MELDLVLVPSMNIDRGFVRKNWKKDKKEITERYEEKGEQDVFSGSNRDKNFHFSNETILNPDGFQ